MLAASDSLHWTLPSGEELPLDFSCLLLDGPVATEAGAQGPLASALAGAQARDAFVLALNDAGRLPPGVAFAPTPGVRLLALQRGGRVDEALASWLEPADTPRLCVLVSPVPLTLEPGARFQRSVLEALLARVAQSSDRLLVVSAGAGYSMVRELSRNGTVFGHELVISGAKSGRVPQRALDTFGSPQHGTLLARTIGRGQGAGFAELYIQRSVREGPPETRVYFHLTGGRRELELSELLGARWSGRAAPELRAELGADWVERADRLALDPARDGGLLPFFSYPLGAEDVVQRCLRLAGSARVEALVLAELVEVKARRVRRPGAAPKHQPYTTGLALSGGGIRSATVSLGFMRELQQAEELSTYDYVSSVSGGSYASAYLQVMTSAPLLALTGEARTPEQMYPSAFQQQDIDVLLEKSSFLAVGRGALSVLNYARLGTSFLTSLVQHWTWLLSVFISLGALTALAQQLCTGVLRTLLWLALVGVVARMIVSLDTRRYRPIVQRYLDAQLNLGETVVAVLLIGMGSLWALSGASQALEQALPGALREPYVFAPACLLVTLVLTLLISPNSTSLHRYYAARLADTFLKVLKRDTWPEQLRVSRKILQQVKTLNVLDRDDAYGPYPIFNGCVNLLGDDPAFAGQQTGDYFAFTPKFCGSKLVGYASTAPDKQFGGLTLAEALTCSGAAISPFQGRAMPSLKSILLWLFNLRTDLWLPNPARPRTRRFITWGPWHQLRALMGKLDTRSPFVNVSDGAFIDSLGVYELLRRGCKRIVAVDATYDPLYDFHTLRNLVQRARFELNLRFEFDQQPEDVIKPDVTTGFSRNCVVSANVIDAEDHVVARLVYVKTARLRDDTRGSARIMPSRAYAMYHPEFPQHSTGDQFFDPLQWLAYHELGREMARRYLDTRPGTAAANQLTPLDEAAQ